MTVTPAGPTRTGQVRAGSEEPRAQTGGPSSARLPVRSYHLRALPYYAPSLATAARAALTANGPGVRHDSELLVDLSEVGPGPFCAELVFLIGLLQRALGPVSLRLVGVTPAIAAPLIQAGLGDNVQVVDTRGRCWPGQAPGIRW
jgi:hypothetical protein